MSSLLIEFEGSQAEGFFAWITVNRPEALNALNQTVLAELDEVLDAVLEKSKREVIHALAITGAGEKAFVAGADISEMRTFVGDGSQRAREFAEKGQAVFRKLETLPFPVIAMVNGFALGGGTELALSCDLIIAGEKAVFGQPEVKLGLIPGFGGTQRLPLRVGMGRAMDLILSGRQLKAEEAYRMGLCDRVVPDSELETTVINLMEQFAAASPLAISHAKRAIHLSSHRFLEAGLKEEAMEFGNLFTSFDTKEGTSAFLEKRKPQFKGK